MIFNSFKYEWFYDLSSFSFIPKGFFNRFYICVASSNSIQILMETQFYKKADLLLKIVSVNQISIKQEIRFFTNKLISWKPSFIIVSARYPKFMIKSWKFFWTLLGSFLLKMLRETSLKITDVITFLSIFFFSTNFHDLSTSMERKFYADSTLQINYAVKISIFQNLRCWTIATYILFLNMLRFGES